MFGTTLVKGSSERTKKSISWLVIEACKCVGMNSCLRHFLMRRKGMIVSQNKFFNNLKTAQLPGALRIPTRALYTHGYILLFPCPFIESPLKFKKNASYFILKALFVLKIFKFLSWLFSHVGKTDWLET